MAQIDFPPQVLPPGTRRLADKAPVAPPGAILVLGDEGGYAVPARAYTLLFGRERDDVHVPIGTDDPCVSRKHGMFTCAGREWWLRNTGQLPIELLGGSMLLRGHETRLRAGYTPLIIRSSARRSHMLEVRVIDSPRGEAACTTSAATARPDSIYELDLRERLALTALAQRYLTGDSHAQPLTWRQTADSLNCAAASTKIWTDRSVENIVSRVRVRLQIPGTSRAEVEEPVGNKLNDNLIQELVRTTTLMPQDLRLLDAIE